MTDHPSGQIAPIGATRDTDFCRVRPSLGNGVIDTSEAVRLRRFAPIAFDRARVRLAVAFGAAWVGIQNHEPFCGKRLVLVEQVVDIPQMRAAVYIKNGWEWPGVLVVAGRQKRPAGDRVTVGRRGVKIGG